MRTWARDWKVAPLLLLPLLAAAVGCKKDSAPAPAVTPAATESAAGAGTNPAAEPGAGPNVPPLPSHDSAMAPPAMAAPAEPAPGLGLNFDLPKGWERGTPSSQMRVLQATIPGPGGPGDFALFFFGPGQGGNAESNLTRWEGQMAGGIAKRESFQSNGLTVTWVDASGTLQPTGMGMGPTTPQADYRLFGAVVEGPGGPWFFKATGPNSTLSAARDAFVAMLKGARARAGQSA